MSSEYIPVCKPKLPLAETILPYLQCIDENRWYTNFGPLVNEFLARISTLFDILPQQVVSCTNGTLLLELCLKALKIEAGSLCILPSWTFAATPLAIMGANLEPFFVDVELETQAIDPTKLLLDLPIIAHSGKIGAVIVIAPFGKPLNVAAWDAFTQQSGIPVIIDAAAAFDTILRCPEMAVGRTPMMVSLHATKVFGMGEGALLFSTNTSLLLQVEQLTQFGFPRGERNSHSLGTNAKLSEYAAAVGLATLDNWPNIQANWLKTAYHYQLALVKVGIQHMLSSQWATSTCNIILPQKANAAAEWLNAHKISTRKWWSEGCHAMPVFKNKPGLFPLKNTNFLRDSILGLPFYLDMPIDYITQIVDCLNSSPFSLSKGEFTYLNTAT